MSDRVPFGTNEDTATPANSSGFNGFPFPYTPGGSGDDFPIAVPLADCIEIYWRIKNWNISTDIIVTDSSPTPPDTYPMQSGDMTPSASNATRELDLIFSIDHQFQEPTGAWSIPFGVIPPINESGETFYPAIVLSASLGGPFAVVSFNPSVVGFPFVAAGSFTGSVKGLPITVYMFLNSSISGLSITGSFLDITPIEWWPYAAKDGSPIYDTSTGAQLQDPRN
jgi:hypothetical protein